MRCIVLFIFLSALMVSVPARQQGAISLQRKDTAIVHTDSSTLHVRTFETGSLRKYKDKEAFNYQEHIAPSNWWQQFKQWFYQRIRKLFAYKGSAIVFKWLFISMGVAAFVFLIYKLSGMNLMAIFGKKTKAITDSPFDEVENIHVIQFEKEIKQAIEQGNFRQAVRLLYLQSLKDLTDKGLIDWQAGKTNNIYLQELPSSSLKEDFTKLTGQFEFIWYGGFSIAAADFVPLQDQFNSFKQILVKT